MSIIDTLITNRTEADVSRWLALLKKGFAAMTPEEKEEWLSGMRGAYNATDLNRVGEAAVYISQTAQDILAAVAAYLEEKGVATAPIFQPYTAEDAEITLPDISGGRTVWEMQDLLADELAQAYLGMISTLRGLLQLPDGTPNVPADLDALTWEEANAIETILLTVYNALIAWQQTAEGQADYISGYSNQLISGTFYAGNYRTLQHFSRGR